MKRNCGTGQKGQVQTISIPLHYSSDSYWGQANYFAEKAKYSDVFAFTSTDGTKELLLAKV